jgi:hypothetical protein
MLGGFIKYLEQCDWKDRGHRTTDRERTPKEAKTDSWIRGFEDSKIRD